MLLTITAQNKILLSVLAKVMKRFVAINNSILTTRSYNVCGTNIEFSVFNRFYKNIEYNMFLKVKL